MSTPTQEQAFYDAVLAAEGVRQSSKASAQATYGFVKANYAAYVTALVAADTTFHLGRRGGNCERDQSQCGHERPDPVCAHG